MMGDLIEREVAIAAITLGNTVTHLQNNIRALPAAQVAVKPLVWVQEGKQPKHAVSLIGTYLLMKDFDGWRWMREVRGNLANVCQSPFSDVERAQAAVQADYDTCIRAALDVGTETGGGKISGPLSDDRTETARPAAASMVRECSDTSQPAPVSLAEAARVLDLIRAAVTEHHLAFDRRQHGGVADRHLAERVQEILGMPWKQGEALRSIADGTK